MHVIPAIAGVDSGVPMLHVSTVQSFMSSNESASSLIVVIAPLPSHTADLQSPAVCVAAGVFAATFIVPQTPLSQVAVTHSLPEPGQSAGNMQPPVPPVEPPVDPPVEPPVEPPVDPPPPVVEPLDPPPPMDVVVPPPPCVVVLVVVPPFPAVDVLSSFFSSN